MRLNRIDHISIAVKNLEQAKKQWAPLLGKTEPDDAYIDEPEQISVARYYIGEVGVELMESISPDGEVARFIERNGEGVMLISFNVDKTADAVDELEKQGYPIVGGLRDFRDCKFAFVHPRAASGVLVEYIDDKSSAPSKK